MPINHVNADWSSTFIEGVNNYSSSGTISLNTATITNAPISGQLPTYNYTQYGDSKFKGCIPINGVAKNCKEGRYVSSLPADRIEFSKCESSSSINVKPLWEENYTIVTDGEYKDIELDFGPTHTIEFASDNSSGVYKIKSLNIGSGKIKLAAGQYWIETLSLKHGVELIFPDTGIVSFFVKNDYTHFNLSLIGDAERFLLYNYGNFTLNGAAKLTGYVVSENKGHITVYLPSYSDEILLSFFSRFPQYRFQIFSCQFYFE